MYDPNRHSARPRRSGRGSPCPFSPRWILTTTVSHSPCPGFPPDPTPHRSCPAARSSRWSRCHTPAKPSRMLPPRPMASRVSEPEISQKMAANPATAPLAASRPRLMSQPVASNVRRVQSFSRSVLIRITILSCVVLSFMAARPSPGHVKG